jgi:hypothetical protein
LLLFFPGGKNMDWLKEILSDWKVTVALVGGALVVGSVFGTCTFEPGASEEAEEVSVDAEEVSSENSTTASTTTETTNNVNEDNTSTETTNTETTTEAQTETETE